MFQNMLGLVCTLGGVFFYFVGTTAERMGNSVTASEMHRTSWLMWGSALVLFVWAIARARQ